MPYGTKGSARPDLIYIDESGHISMVEIKTYTNAESLCSNIERQTEARLEQFGEDIDLTYSVNGGYLTLEDADQIYETCMKMGVDVEWQTY